MFHGNRLMTHCPVVGTLRSADIWGYVKTKTNIALESKSCPLVKHVSDSLKDQDKDDLVTFF